MTLSIQTSTSCFCGCAVSVSPDRESPAGVPAVTAQWSARCSDCYDGADDAGELAHVVGWGESPENALWAWADTLEEVSQIALTDSGRAALEVFRADERMPASSADLIGDLARDVSVEASRQRRSGMVFFVQRGSERSLPFMPTRLDETLRHHPRSMLVFETYQGMI